jgi:putative Holliday junction resolvase
MENFWTDRPYTIYECREQEVASGWTFDARRTPGKLSAAPVKRTMSRTIAFDYGERRIGVAVSDPTRTIASPLTTLQRRAGKRPPWAEIAAIVQEQEADEAVIGLPLDLSGAEGAWAAEVRQFGADLARRTGLPVQWMDERLSSVRAERSIQGMGLKKNVRERKGMIDATAAALILEGYLALRRNQAAAAETESSE